jgi:hypothetical protein
MAWTKSKTIAAVAAVISILGSGAIVGILHGFADTPCAAAAALGDNGAERLRDKAIARVRAAEKLLDKLEQRQEADEALTPSFVELKAAAQRRLADARIDASEDAESRIREAEEYVSACRKMVGLLNALHETGGDVTSVQVAQAAYYLADAEYLFEKLKLRAAS